MTCFDWLADGSARNDGELQQQPWDLQLLLRPSRAGNDDQLKQQRKDFIANQAIERRKGSRGSREFSVARTLTSRHWQDFKAAGLVPGPGENIDVGDLPGGSARLVLKFGLVQPLLTAEADSFTLFDNALRKDPLFRLPHLSAAAVKGLAADAYQRAFPPDCWASPQEWQGLGDGDPARTRAFRLGDHPGSARRLFGIADAKADRDEEDAGTETRERLEPSSAIGRLQFTPVWFEKIQFLIMNPKEPSTERGLMPIEFEAVAPGQEGVVAITYFNAPGFDESDENTVRADLARLVWALAEWWPVLGLGAKRLAGYGTIVPLEGRIDTYGWSHRAGLHSERRSGEESWGELAQWLNEET